MKYRKRPVIIEAMRWSPRNPGELLNSEFFASCTHIMRDDGLYIETLEGSHFARPGDMIIKGVKGEFYPCKPDIFELTYEPVPADEEDTAA